MEPDNTSSVEELQLSEQDARLFVEDDLAYSLRDDLKYWATRVENGEDPVVHAFSTKPQLMDAIAKCRRLDFPLDRFLGDADTTKLFGKDVALDAQEMRRGLEMLKKAFQEIKVPVVITVITVDGKEEHISSEENPFFTFLVLAPSTPSTPWTLIFHLRDYKHCYLGSSVQAVPEEHKRNGDIINNRWQIDVERLQAANNKFAANASRSGYCVLLEIINIVESHVTLRSNKPPVLVNHENADKRQSLLLSSRYPFSPSMFSLSRLAIGFCLWSDKQPTEQATTPQGTTAPREATAAPTAESQPTEKATTPQGTTAPSKATAAPPATLPQGTTAPNKKKAPMDATAAPPTESQQMQTDEGCNAPANAPASTVHPKETRDDSSSKQVTFKALAAPPAESLPESQPMQAGKSETSNAPAPASTVQPEDPLTTATRDDSSKTATSKATAAPPAESQTMQTNESENSNAPASTNQLERPKKFKLQGAQKVVLQICPFIGQEGEPKFTNNPGFLVNQERLQRKAPYPKAWLIEEASCYSWEYILEFIRTQLVAHAGMDANNVVTVYCKREIHPAKKYYNEIDDQLQNALLVPIQDDSDWENTLRTKTFRTRAEGEKKSGAWLPLVASIRPPRKAMETADVDAMEEDKEEEIKKMPPLHQQASLHSMDVPAIGNVGQNEDKEEENKKMPPLQQQASLHSMNVSNGSTTASSTVARLVGSPKTKEQTELIPPTIGYVGQNKDDALPGYFMLPEEYQGYYDDSLVPWSPPPDDTRDEQLKDDMASDVSQEFRCFVCGHRMQPLCMDEEEIKKLRKVPWDTFPSYVHATFEDHMERCHPLEDKACSAHSGSKTKAQRALGDTTVPSEKPSEKATLPSEAAPYIGPANLVSSAFEKALINIPIRKRDHASLRDPQQVIGLVARRVTSALTSTVEHDNTQSYGRNKVIKMVSEDADPEALKPVPADVVKRLMTEPAEKPSTERRSKRKLPSQEERSRAGKQGRGSSNPPTGASKKKTKKTSQRSASAPESGDKQPSRNRQLVLVDGNNQPVPNKDEFTRARKTMRLAAAAFMKDFLDSICATYHTYPRHIERLCKVCPIERLVNFIDLLFYDWQGQMYGLQLTPFIHQRFLPIKPPTYIPLVPVMADCKKSAPTPLQLRFFTESYNPSTYDPRLRISNYTGPEVAKFTSDGKANDDEPVSTKEVAETLAGLGSDGQPPNVSQV